ncbi:MAG: hypothetical protein ACRDIV_11875 [Ktedonobacteraceae bacterium]
MDAFVFFLVVGLIIVIGVLASVRLHMPDTLEKGHFRRIRRLRTLRARPGFAAPAGTVIEEVIEETVPDEEEEEV